MIKDYNLDTLAKWTRVDWHNNPAKLHVFFIFKTPLRSIKRKNIEVYCEKPHLICVYGIHKDGNRIEPYDTEKQIGNLLYECGDFSGLCDDCHIQPWERIKKILDICGGNRYEH